MFAIKRGRFLLKKIKENGIFVLSIISGIIMLKTNKFQNPIP